MKNYLIKWAWVIERGHSHIELKEGTQAPIFEVESERLRQ